MRERLFGWNEMEIFGFLFFIQTLIFQLHRIDRRTAETTAEKSALYPHEKFASVVLRDDIYVLGGSNDEGNLNIVERYEMSQHLYIYI